MALTFAAFGLGYLSLFVAAAETRRFAVSGLEAVPAAILALLAYLGQERRWGKVITVLYWLALAVGLCFIVVGSVVV
jgi:hypothetical protein